MGKNKENENVHIERLDNTQVRRPVLQERFLKASPTRLIQSYIEAYGYPELATISAYVGTPEERAIARDSYMARQAEERLKKKGLLIRENIGFVPLVGDAVDTGITTLEVATGREKPYMMGLSLLGFLPFGDWFKKYFKRTGRIPEDLKILKDDMNVKLLYIEDLVLNVMKQSPDITREQATELVNGLLREQGISPIKGGWMLKGLMKGSPLEKLLSKTGTININGLLAYLNKASKLELDVIGKILSTKFAGLKNIDYNALRKAISDELITYSRVPKVDYEDYGIEGLGFKRKPFPERSPGLMFGVEDFMHDSELNKAFPYPVKFNTFTFESPRIPRGNDLHYDITTLGHSRTFTIPEEPDILYIMESQSDWGLKTKDLTPRFTYKRDINGNTNIIFDENGRFHYTENGKGMPYSEFMDLSKPNDLLPFNIAKTQFLENYPMAQVNHLHTNYLQRQLQENMKYAAEQGQKRMRYPTSETAAKIEGYQKTTITDPKISDEYRALDLEKMQLYNEQLNLGIFDPKNDVINKRLEEIKLREQELNSMLDYSPEHQTILKKYSDFPKMFGKLFKGLEVRIVTDPKGNTWYEVDIPENFLQSEWQFKKGGILGLSKTIGL